MAVATVLYDAGCGPCRWTAWQLRRWDRLGRLRFVDLRSGEADELLHDLSRDRRRSTWHVVTSEGVVSGGRAVPRALELLPVGRPLAAFADRFPGLSDRLYGWVADHRRAIGRLLGQDACAVDPSAPRANDPAG